MYQHGWFNIAFQHELAETLTPAVIGDRRLVLARTDQGIRAFNADCPHRGAHLAYGGRLDNDCIVCPFHGYRVGIGEKEHLFRAEEYPTLVIGDLIFVRLSDAYENGFSAFMTRLAKDHYVLPGFIMPVKVAAPVVIENAFDALHFPAVHHLKTDKLTFRSEDGALIVETHYEFPAGERLKRFNIDYVRSHFIGRAFSPCLIVTQLRSDEFPYTVITATTPLPDGDCVIRLSFLLPIEKFGNPPAQEFCDMMIHASQGGLRDDQLIWEHLSPTAPHNLTAGDRGIVEFQAFCRQFAYAASPDA
jgi:3-ketosteroid 9alpha-monooxygenase subunit A